MDKLLNKILQVFPTHKRILKTANPNVMTNFKCKSIAFTLGLISFGTYDLIASTWTHSESSTVIVVEPTLINDAIHHVGDLYGGGVIFFVDKTGQHGLICSMSEIRDPKSLELFRRQDPRPLTGRKDSAFIINQVFAVDNPDHAKELCDYYSNSNYGTGVFSDWHLPTLDELKTMYKVKDELNKVLENYNKALIDPLAKCYWSSTIANSEDLGDNWQFDFSEGSPVLWVKTNRSIPGRYYVRAIRAF